MSAILNVGHVKRHSGLERTVMKSNVSGSETGRPVQRWPQNIKDTLDMKMLETGELLKN